MTQDEGVLAKGTGNTCPDAIIQEESVQLRAERAGKGDGRVYRISFEASDISGATCTGAIKVCVPHDRARQCVENDEIYSSINIDRCNSRERHNKKRGKK